MAMAEVWNTMDSSSYQIPLIDFPCGILPAATPYSETNPLELSSAHPPSLASATRVRQRLEADFNSACRGATLSAPTSEQSTSKDDPQTPGWTKRRMSSGSGRQAKKTAGSKPGSKTVAKETAGSLEALGGELGAALEVPGPASKAKRSRATPVATRAPSVRAKAKLGDLTSMESAKIRAADKNMDVTDVDSAGEGARC
ncbi:uncharacterized protein LOC125516011 isoform X1 [Triticum urartu]|uniref:uncharacterized protein LOC125516011 isoform X1 n=1 Tax=Triticum urartu TaxID=4572 RepID=UPI002043A9B1|nr:uncharacterized protein LOC125516011 isoform X1 [Triticum urartu]